MGLIQEPINILIMKLKMDDWKETVVNGWASL
jgi:hypothetical protein